jgi:CheY-like chemotaxis protein
MARILIAEDERDIRELITFTLNFAGHDVIPTANGEEAVTRAIQEIPDLILLDIRMPRMTGYDACRKIKSDGLTRHIPVVFLSAKGQQAEIRAGYEAGATDYIVKPFAPDLLAQRIGTILSDHEK